MPQSKAHMEATNRYNAKAYDNLRIVVPRGRKAEIDAYTKKRDLSTNELVNLLWPQEVGKDEETWKKKE